MIRWLATTKILVLVQAVTLIWKLSLIIWVFLLNVTFLLLKLFKNYSIVGCVVSMIVWILHIIFMLLGLELMWLVTFSRLIPVRHDSMHIPHVTSHLNLLWTVKHRTQGTGYEISNIWRQSLEIWTCVSPLLSWLQIYFEVSIQSLNSRLYPSYLNLRVIWGRFTNSLSSYWTGSK